jgi:formylglycine-generating enzyme required for sulfatase activity
LLQNHAEHWQETLLLAMGVMAIVNNMLDKAQGILESLLEENKPVLTLFTGEVLNDVGASALGNRISQQIKRTLIQLMQNPDVDLPTRAKAGRILSDVGDPRLGVTVKKSSKGAQLIPDIDWQLIQVGTFQMGLPKNEKKTNWDQNAQPQHPVSIEKPFYISRYPVTNAQYQCFVEAGMYQDEAFWQSLPAAAYRWWQGGEADEKLLKTIKDKDYQENYRNWLKNDKDRRTPYYWSDQKWNGRNHPVVGVSWFEALAYSVWLNRVLSDVHPDAQSNAQSQGKIRLPYEEEWEFAARGTDNRLYPWKGNEISASHANYHDTGLRRTSAVGLFPKSEEAGLYDMSGNTWEWMQSRWGNDLNSPYFTYKNWKSLEERNDINPVEARIIRGGSWFYSPDLLRSAFRFRYHPDLRYYDLGFRVVFVEF